MSNYQIDRNIPLPVHGHTPTGVSATARQLMVGESFFAAGKKRMTVASSMSALGAKIGRKFTVRAEGDGVRIWRVR